MNHVTVFAGALAASIASVALGQVTNEGLLEQAKGREQQRMRDRQSYAAPNTEMLIAEDRERKLEHCLAVAVSGAPVPQKCIDLIPKSERPIALQSSQNAVVTTSNPSIALSAPPTGPRRVRAKTPSGYCLDAPVGYVGTGAENAPPVTTALPRCDQLSAR